MSKSSNNLDGQIGAYDPSFAYYNESVAVHADYGERIARCATEQGIRSVLSLGIGHTEIARVIVGLLATNTLDRYVIVDGSPALIASFREVLGSVPPGLSLVEGFFETVELEGQFEFIEAGFVLEHVDDPGLILRRMHQFLAPGGKLFVAVPNARSLHRLIGHYAGFLPDMYVLSPADLTLGHQHYFDLASLTELVQSCGYKIEKTEGMLLKPFTTQQLGQLDLCPEVWSALRQVAVDYPEISNMMCMELTACV